MARRSETKCRSSRHMKKTHRHMVEPMHRKQTWTVVCNDNALLPRTSTATLRPPPVQGLCLFASFSLCRANITTAFGRCWGRLVVCNVSCCGWLRGASMTYRVLDSSAPSTVVEFHLVHRADGSIPPSIRKKSRHKVGWTGSSPRTVVTAAAASALFFVFHPGLLVCRCPGLVGPLNDRHVGKTKTAVLQSSHQTTKWGPERVRGRVERRISRRHGCYHQGMHHPSNDNDDAIVPAVERRHRKRGVIDDARK
jgi:hypothetical protein